MPCRLLSMLSMLPAIAVLLQAVWPVLDSFWPRL